MSFDNSFFCCCCCLWNQLISFNYLHLRGETRINLDVGLFFWSTRCASRVLFFIVGKWDGSDISLHMSENDIEIVSGNFVEVCNDCKIQENNRLFLSESKNCTDITRSTAKVPRAKKERIDLACQIFYIFYQKLMLHMLIKTH